MSVGKDYEYYKTYLVPYHGAVTFVFFLTGQNFFFLVNFSRSLKSSPNISNFIYIYHNPQLTSKCI